MKTVIRYLLLVIAVATFGAPPARPQDLLKCFRNALGLQENKPVTAGSLLSAEEEQDFEDATREAANASPDWSISRGVKFYRDDFKTVYALVGRDRYAKMLETAQTVISRKTGRRFLLLTHPFDLKPRLYSLDPDDLKEGRLSDFSDSDGRVFDGRTKSYRVVDSYGAAGKKSFYGTFSHTQQSLGSIIAASSPENAQVIRKFRSEVEALYENGVLLDYGRLTDPKSFFKVKSQESGDEFWVLHAYEGATQSWFYFSENPEKLIGRPLLSRSRPQDNVGYVNSINEGKQGTRFTIEDGSGRTLHTRLTGGGRSVKMIWVQTPQPE